MHKRRHSSLISNAGWQQQPLPMNGPDTAPVLPGYGAERGAVFTRREIVEFVLDLAGYVPDRPLRSMRLLEPCIGQGDFLFPIIDRLLAAWKSDPQKTQPVADLCNALCGVELHRETFLETRRETVQRLLAHGLSASDANALAATWLRQGDFLLVDLNSGFHFVIGNPPYVRQELIPDRLLAEYRARYYTIFDRADLYIPFIERSLTLLAEGGQLGFICSDRWMKNRYGALLRQMVSANFHLKIYVDMFDTPAFQSDVIAYPAITIIAREQGVTTRVAHRPALTSLALPEIAGLLTAPDLPTGVDAIQSLKGVTAGAEPWVLESPDQLALVRRLQSEFPTLEDAGCKVGIGVATGADAVFIAPYDALDVEPDRKLPLVTTGDIVAAQVEWGGLGVINPFAEDGSLVSLAHYPRLRQYLAAHKAVLSNRHVARKNPANWYRTIDRIYPTLVSTPKLLIPDIKSEACITYEDGHFYPHHNLYYVTSEDWDLKALQAVLQSGIARLFVFMYSTRMRGGYVRFQAQYLRRIRVPYWHQVPPQLKEALLLAVERGDTQSSRHLVWQIYGLSEAEKGTLGCSVE